MPTYQFACDTCNIINEFKLSFSEHSALKNNIFCEKCNEKMRQVVAPLNFRLEGEGWFGKAADAIDHPYSITQRELNKNLENEKRVEDAANNYNAKVTE